MRARTAVLLLLAALFTSFVSSIAPPAHAADLVLVQESEGQGADESGEGATDSSEGSGKPGAEVGANEGQSDSAESGTEGPPWTYQMARIVLALLLLMALAIGLLYWRLVVQRQRRGI